MAAGGGRYFCTAGRGLEPFLAQEVRARLGATEVRGERGLVRFEPRSRAAAAWAVPPPAWGPTGLVSVWVGRDP